MKPVSSSSSIVSFCIRYGTAILAVAAALAITLLIFIFIKSIASPLFLVAIVIVAWKHGMRPAIFATILSGIAIDYFFVSPTYQLSGNTDDILRLLIFAAEGYFLCWLIIWKTNATEEIENSREQLQALSLRQQTLIEAERKRIALEIHDELGQALTGLKMDMHLIKQGLNGNSEKRSLGETNEQLDMVLGTIDSSIMNVRRIATELRPPILDDLGLVAAIEWQTQEFQRRTGITCVLSANVENVEMDTQYSTAVFRIFQESLTNIIRHAEANTISVMLRKLDHKLVLRVEDDGKGIQEDQFNNKTSLGLLGMRERGRLIGAELNIFNGDENGTIVMLTASVA